MFPLPVPCFFSLPYFLTISIGLSVSVTISSFVSFPFVSFPFLSPFTFLLLSLVLFTCFSYNFLVSFLFSGPLFPHSFPFSSLFIFTVFSSFHSPSLFPFPSIILFFHFLCPDLAPFSFALSADLSTPLLSSLFL